MASSRIIHLGTLLFATAAFGCGSKEEPATPAGDGGTDAVTDSGPKPDTGKPPTDSAPEVIVSPIDISGTLDITARVVTINDKREKVPMADFGARIENAGGGFIDGVTGSDGIVHLKVDPSKGPFDVTIAKVGFGIVSVVGITGPVGDLITYDLAADTGTTASITGTITGKADPANKIQIDAWAFSTVVTAAGATTYTSKYSNSPDLPIPVAALEADSTGKIINGVITPSIARSGSAMKVDIAMPSPANPPKTRTLTIKLPTTGAVGGKLTKIADPTSDKHFGNAVVIKTKGFAQMFVGVADMTVPSGGSATVKVQAYDTGDLSPDTVIAAFTGGQLFARINLKDVADGSTTTIGDVKTLDVSGSALGDVTFSTEGTGYEYSELQLSDSGGGTNGVVWRCYGNGPKLASRGLPHLPASVKLTDVAGIGFSPRATVVLFHRTGASATPWGDNASFDWVVSNTTTDPLDPSGR